MLPEIYNKAKNNARHCVIPVDGIRTLRAQQKRGAIVNARYTPVTALPSTAFRAFWQWQKGGRIEAKYLERWIYSVPRLNPGSMLLKNANESPFVLANLRRGETGL